MLSKSQKRKSYDRYGIYFKKLIFSGYNNTVTLTTSNIERNANYS